MLQTIPHAAQSEHACRPTSATLPTFQIRAAQTSEDLEAVYRFRYLIYVEEMKRKQVYADHVRRRIVDPLDEGAINLVAWSGEEVVGTLRINFPRDSFIGQYEEFYEMGSVGEDHPQHTSINTRLMVAPHVRNTGLGLSLGLASYAYGAPLGIKWNFIDCNDHLLPFYLGLGYIAHAPKAEHPEYGLVNRLRLNALDMKHFVEIRSPLGRVLAQLQAGKLLGSEP
jgi:GNAT superfamily N-acetyltransferase